MQHSRNLLPDINSPDDIKKLSVRELNRLSDEVRRQIVSVVSGNGGHLSSNLGVVELSIALHYVFDSPKDKIVWDVGHQCYAHKLLTGRYESFQTLRRQGGIAGFPKNSESPHDVFNTGHASTSISAALGLLAAERIQGGKGHAVAVIGDGALTGGMAYEALSHAGHLGLPLIVILNDNKMSISRNVGGLSKYLSRLSMKAKYQTFRRHFDSMTKKIPFVGDAFFSIVLRLKRAVKAVFYIDNFFVDLGFEYVGPIGGHNIQALLDVLKDVKKLNRPVVIHVITRKGKGYSYAEYDPDSYHGVGSFSIEGGIENTAGINKNIDEKDEGLLPSQNLIIRKSFTQCFSEALMAIAKDNKKITAVTAAMQTGTGLSDFAQNYPDRFFDVGIAEEHAVTFAAGLAANGLRPITALYSTFIQRSVDQVIHDASLQKLPVIFALDRAGLVGADGETHQGLFDISIFRSVPNMTILAPTSGNELKLMLEWAVNREQGEIEKFKFRNSGPVIIRYPKAFCPEEVDAFSQPLEKGRGVWINRSGKKDVCLVFTGSLYREVKEAQAILKDKGIEADLYNLRFIKPVDEDFLTDIMNDFKLVCFLEEGIKEGGFGEYAAAMSQQKKCKAKTVIMAVESGFLENDALGTREELLAKNNLDGRSIADKVSCSL
ncbi:MAG: 1-deoxy-D-xylulose-5-phosphate synthase [Treponema sp.]|jgi:1-deoxy-D-xylulose-5-phosphate synthase|nr:1-deoxy-D-xylulose-5-phosphate synthase [Treponema sp.]